MTVIDDQVDEATETLTVRLSDPQGAALRVATATGTIIDDDQRALLVEPRELNVPEGGIGSYRVMLGSKPTGPVMARVLEPAEVSVDPKELAFTPADWSIAQAVEVTGSQDPDSRADPPVVLLHEVSGGDYDGTTASVRVTVVEDDAATLAVSGGRTAEGGRRLNFQVTLSMASSMEVTVDYATGAAGDTATAGVDYAPARDTLTFAAGSTATQTIDVTVYDDTIDEPDEQVTVTLRNARNALLAGGGDTASATGTIDDDDDLPELSIRSSSLTEGAAGGEMRFVVTLDRASSQTVTVRYDTADVTAAAGADYTRASATLTFDPGQLTRTIVVAVTDDALDEPDEELMVTLSAATHAKIETAGDAAPACASAPSSISAAISRSRKPIGCCCALGSISCSARKRRCQPAIFPTLSNGKLTGSPRSWSPAKYRSCQNRPRSTTPATASASSTTSMSLHCNCCARAQSASNISACGPCSRCSSSRC